MTNDLSLSQLLAQYNMNNPNNLPFPMGAYHRSDKWQYVGFIANPPPPTASSTFGELVEREKNRGGIREVDTYEWGAVCWVKE